MVRQKVFSNIALFVCGGLAVFVLQKIPVQRLEEYSHETPLTRRLNSVPDGTGPRVFTHDGTVLKRVHGFCAMLPTMDCAMMDTTAGPMPVYIHHTKTSGVSGAIVRKRGHEPHIMRTIQNELEKYPSAAFVDIGSNIGPFSLQAGKLGRTVIAVDAVLMNIQRLCRSVDKNGLSDRVSMVVNPVSDQHTSVSLDRGPSATFEMSRVSSVAGTKNQCGDTDMLKTVLLDDLLLIASFETAVVKVDVEGFEYFVIKGGQKFLKEIRVPSIVMEWKHVMKTKGRELIDMLSGLSYIPYSFTDRKYEPLNKSNYTSWPLNVIWKKK